MTNGEKLKEIFPCKTKEQPYSLDKRSVFYEGLDFIKLFRTSWWNAEYKEPTTENCESCRYYGSHNEVCNYCYKCSLWTEQEPKPMVEIDLYSVIKQKYIEREVLDKIRTDIQKLRNCSCSCSDGIIDDVEDIIDKYKAECEE